MGRSQQIRIKYTAASTVKGMPGGVSNKRLGQEVSRQVLKKGTGKGERRGRREEDLETKALIRERQEPRAGP